MESCENNKAKLSQFKKRHATHEAAYTHHGDASLKRCAMGHAIPSVSVCRYKEVPEGQKTSRVK
jgi:hypothetical protein